MTIRLTENVKHPQVADSNVGGYIVHGQLGGRLAITDTREEAEQAKRAFEQVLAPRFTRDEAIAIVKKATQCGRYPRLTREFTEGVRAALEALAAAGVFWDGRNMWDKLDAAGIK